MPTTVNTLPAKLNAEIRQGARWTGVALRFVDQAGDPEVLTVTGRVRTDTVDNGGVLVATCDVSAKDSDGYYTVSLDADATRELPQRQVFVEVSVWRGGMLRTVSDAVLASNTTVTSATAAFTTADIGRVIAGTGIPSGTTITARASSTSVTISAAATVTGSGRTVSIGSSTDPDRVMWITADVVGVVDEADPEVP